MNVVKVKVPEGFCLSPFYSKGDVIDIPLGDLSLWGDILFQQDIAHILNLATDTSLCPWNNSATVTKEGIALWKMDGYPTIGDCFRERDRKNARPLMIKYLSIYIQLMYWVQGKPVNSINPETIERFSYSPMNIQERLQFILNSPDHYHSFTALSQLFQESEKKWAVYFAKLKKST